MGLSYSLYILLTFWTSMAYSLFDGMIFLLFCNRSDGPSSCRPSDLLPHSFSGRSAARLAARSTLLFRYFHGPQCRSPPARSRALRPCPRLLSQCFHEPQCRSPPARSRALRPYGKGQTESCLCASTTQLSVCPFPHCFWLSWTLYHQSPVVARTGILSDY